MIIDSQKIPPQISGATIKALCHLTEVGETRATDLANLVGFTTAAATGLIDRGEKLAAASSPLASPPPVASWWRA